jgi:hypothetical protein
MTGLPYQPDRITLNPWWMGVSSFDCCQCPRMQIFKIEGAEFNIRSDAQFNSPGLTWGAGRFVFDPYLNSWSRYQLHNLQHAVSKGHNLDSIQRGNSI